MKAVKRTVKGLLVDILRAEARAWRLRGTGRLANMLYPWWDRQKDFYACVVPLMDAMIQVDTWNVIEWTIYMFGGWDIASVKLLRSLVRSGDIVFDVGANIGAYSIPLARAVGSSGVVHAFEPHPHIRDRLIENIAMNN